MAATPDVTVETRNEIMTRVGNVPDLLRVDIKKITSTTFRVNVWVSSGNGFGRTNRIADSFVHKTGQTTVPSS